METPTFIHRQCLFGFIVYIYTNSLIRMQINLDHQIFPPIPHFYHQTIIRTRVTTSPLKLSILRLLVTVISGIYPVQLGRRIISAPTVSTSDFRQVQAYTYEIARIFRFTGGQFGIDNVYGRSARHKDEFACVSVYTASAAWVNMCLFALAIGILKR